MNQLLTSVRPALPTLSLTELSVAALKRQLRPGTRYHLTHRVGSSGPVAFRGDDLPGREVIKVQSAQVHSRVIGGETTWLTFPVFKNGDTLHATPRGFQFVLAGNDVTLRFEWGDAPEGARVNRPDEPNGRPPTPEDQAEPDDQALKLEQLSSGLTVANVYHHPRFTLTLGNRSPALLQYVPDRTPDPEQTGQWALHRRGMTLRFPPGIRTFEATRAWLLEKPAELLAFLRAD